LAIEAALGHLLDKYIIFLGNDGYRSVFTQGPGGSTFIHEMTHVWQGHNQSFAWTYVGNSLACQCTLGTSAAYKYTAGNQWTSYEAEPQAKIVEHWYQHLVSPGMYSLPPIGTALAPQFQGWSSQYNIAIDIYQAYINCNIRPGQPNAQTVFPRSPLNMHNPSVAAALRRGLIGSHMTSGVQPLSSPVTRLVTARQILPKLALIR
jgi:hypothetical protein